MSPNRVKTVSQLVEKYRRDYPELDRDLIRKLIRLENPELFSNSYANLKQLDRLLAKSFKQQARQKNESERTSFLKDLFDWIEQRAKRKEQERAR